MSAEKNMISARMPADLVSAMRQMAEDGNETFSDVMRRAALMILGVCPTCGQTSPGDGSRSPAGDPPAL